jgi:hypothetical protein
MGTEPLPPGVYPIAVDKYIISYHIIYLHRQVGVKNSSHLPACEDGTVCSETSAYKIQMPGNYPEESIQHSEHGESLKSRIKHCLIAVV